MFCSDNNLPKESVTHTKPELSSDAIKLITKKEPIPMTTCLYLPIRRERATTKT